MNKKKNLTMKNRACIILPYFGKFNSYFQIWLNSCCINRSIDWYIFTNDRTAYEFPQNVKVAYCEFADLRNRIISLFGENVTIDKPYDLCKYRVAYHKIFPNEVKRYSYWGYCDCDLIWGNISKLVASAIDKNYDKISWKGHFTLFRNVADINELYDKAIDGNTTFRNCISREKEKTYNLFDEVCINRVFDACGKSIYKDLLLADLKVTPYNFVCNHFSQQEEYKNKNQIFEWDNGTLYRVYVFDGKIFKEEFGYVHFLRRIIENELSSNMVNHFLIIPNRLIDYEELTVEKILKWSSPHFYWNYYKKRLKWGYLKNKILGDKKLLPDEYLHTIR